ncbi:hypothetical protein [Streptomyces sp. NPDC057545]|uniref:hypothetical protein n=1 Tax=Streptomyces sp. NPDC057545 TaxID=3346164 RepID=UPI0036947321
MAQPLAVHYRSTTDAPPVRGRSATRPRLFRRRSTVLPQSIRSLRTAVAGSSRGFSGARRTVGPRLIGGSLVAEFRLTRDHFTAESRPNLDRMPGVPRWFLIAVRA